MADEPDQRREWERLNKGKARRDFENAGKDVKDKPRDRGARSAGDRSDGKAPPSRPELDRLQEDRKRDHQRGPRPSQELGKGANRLKQREEQRHIQNREDRIQYVSERLNRMKGRARDDFDRSR